jgi:20S proteasome subunit alpha 7
MSSTGSGYDQSVFTYSPEGRIFQVEYAQKAVEAGGTAVGVRCRDGVILGVEKRTLITAMTRKEAMGTVFTNIDSAIVLR